MEASTIIEFSVTLNVSGVPHADLFITQNKREDKHIDVVITTKNLNQLYFVLPNECRSVRLVDDRKKVHKTWLLVLGDKPTETNNAIRAWKPGQILDEVSVPGNII